MPRFLRALSDELTNRLSQKDADRPHRFDGFTSDGRVVLTDFRGRSEARLPEADTKGSNGFGDPLAIYKPTGAKDIDPARAMGEFRGWAYAAINAIAREVSNIQIRLYQIKGEEHVEIDDHPLLDLLETVNDHMTGIELKYTMAAHLELTGNFFAYLDGVSNAQSQPRAIHPLNPGSVRIKVDKSSFPYKIGHYEYTLDGVRYSFQPHQVLHVKYPDPNDQFVGIGVVQTIPVWIDSDNYAMEYNRKFFVNGASVGLYVETNTNVEGQIDRIKRGMRDEYGGVQNANKIPILPKGVELKHTGVTQRDMDFDKLTTTTRDRILAAFGVSKTILGTAESDTNRATSETADYVFSKRTIKPKMLLVMSYLNAYLVPRYGDDLYLTFIDPTPEDKEFRTKEMQAAIGNMPVMTQNEARRTYMGLGPIEGGDQLMQPSTMTPAGQSEQPEGDDPAPALAKTSEGWKAKAIRVRAGGKTVYSAAAKVRNALVEAFKKQIDGTPQFQVKHLKDLTHSEYMEHYKRFDSRTQHAVEQLEKVFLGIDKKQKEEVLDNLPTVTGVKGKRAVKKAIGELFDTKEWIGITIDLVTPILASLTRDEATAALSMIGARQQDILADEGIRNALEQGISKMAHSYNETTLENLKTVLEEKLNQAGGTNLPELTRAVDGVYDFADDRRAGLIAKTEAYRASNLANKDAWRLSEVVKTVAWYTAEDAKVCEFCAALDGTEIDVSDNFFNLGDTMKGVNGGFRTVDYSDIEAPPAHPDCRCYLRPGQLVV